MVLDVLSNQRHNIAGRWEIQGAGSTLWSWQQGGGCSRAHLWLLVLQEPFSPAKPATWCLSCHRSLLPTLCHIHPGTPGGKLGTEDAPHAHPSTAAPMHLKAAEPMHARASPVPDPYLQPLYIHYNPPTGWPGCTWLGRTEHPCDSKGQNECQCALGLSQQECKAALGTRGARRDGLGPLDRVVPARRAGRGTGSTAELSLMISGCVNSFAHSAPLSFCLFQVESGREERGHGHIERRSRKLSQGGCLGLISR